MAFPFNKKLSLFEKTGIEPSRSDVALDHLVQFLSLLVRVRLLHENLTYQSTFTYANYYQKL